MFRLAALGLLLAGCAAPVIVAPPTGPGPASEARGRWREQVHWVPMQEADGTPRLLYTKICRPPGDAPAPVAVINHGTGITRQIVTAPGCDEAYVRWFLDRGYIAVLPLRRGFGATGGGWGEVSGPGYTQGCNTVSHGVAGIEGARDVAATVAYARTLPFARPNGAVVAGASTGGFATMAYASLPHPGVAAFINVSGGRGGQVGGTAGRVCNAAGLVEAAAQYGATADTPMLWVYSYNDSFFPPDLARAMHAAFTQAGGKARLDVVRRLGFDGHALFQSDEGVTIWGPVANQYLADRKGG